jgi:hypothetical protein
MTNAQWRSIVRNAYYELTSGYVESDFPETTMAALFENGVDETCAVHRLVQSRQPGTFSLHDVFRVVDNAYRRRSADQPSLPPGPVDG